MLYSIDHRKVINDIPYEKDYRRWRDRLTEAEYGAITDELNTRIDGGEIHTSSWIPGNNWAGTVYESIYTKACEYDAKESGKCFGLFLWMVLREREEYWAFGRYEKNGVPINGLTYFIVHPPETLNAA
jgi:hypothetical protein